MALFFGRNLSTQLLSQIQKRTSFVVTTKVKHPKYYILADSGLFLDIARTYLQLPLRQRGAGNVYLLVLSSWKVNIVENPIAVMGL